MAVEFESKSTAVKTVTILDTELVSALIDLEGTWQYVVLDIDAAEVAKFGTAADLSLQVGLNIVWLPDGTGIKVIAKPASGGIYAVWETQGASHIRVAISVAATDDLTMRVRGVGKLEVAGILEKATI